MEKKPKPATAEMPPEKAKRLKDLKTKIRARLAEKVSENVKKQSELGNLPDPSDVVLKLTPDTPIRKLIAHGDLSINFIDPRHILLDFTLEENKHLYEPWVKHCRRFRRGPDDQTMETIEGILTQAGLL